jgi:membrane protein DedA with SNARE-associated domain
LGAISSFLEAILSPVVSWVVNLVTSLSYLGVFLAMTIESACVPLPSEIIMPFSGYLVSRGIFNIHLVALAGALGNLVGSLVAYYAGYFGGRRFILRFGKYILIHPEELSRADRFFARFGLWAVLICRVLPIVRTFISLPAGISKMRIVPFILLTFFGSLPWCYLLTYIGLLLGENWSSIRYYFHRFDIVIVLILLLLFGWWLCAHLSKRRARKSVTPSGRRLDK